MNNLGRGLQSKQQMRLVSASTYSTPQLANVAESPHDLMLLKQKQFAMMKEINHKLHATQRYDTTVPLCNDGIIINQNVTLHNGLTIPAGTMFTQMVPPSSQQQQQQQQQYQQLELNIGNSNSAACPDFYSLPSGNGLTLGDTDCSWLGGSSAQLQNRPDYNQNHSRKRTISSITSNNDYNTLLLGGGGSCSGAGEADLDSLIMQPQELDSIDNFFQQALHNQSQLFNQSEQEYFSNFLDGILVGDDEDEDDKNNINVQGATGDTYDPSKKNQQKSNVINPQKLNDSAMFSTGLKQTVDIGDNTQESSDVVGFESALPQSSSFADINAIKLMNPSALPSVSSDINRYAPQSLFQQAPPQRYSVFQPSGSLLPNSRFQQDQQSSQKQQQNKLDKEEPDKGQVDANGPKVVLAPRKKRHASSQLLTEQEKRQNHVLSEQKRRQNIKLGFEAICQLVPSLKLLHGTDAQRSQHNRQGPPPAKTVILGEAIEFLNQLLAENQLLEERALELGRILQLRNIQQTTRHS